MILDKYYGSNIYVNNKLKSTEIRSLELEVLLWGRRNTDYQSWRKFNNLNLNDFQPNTVKHFHHDGIFNNLDIYVM